MNVLVTGGAGFIGSHLVERVLANTDWGIVVLDKLSYAAMGFDRLHQIGALNNPRIKVLTHDLAFPMSEGIRREIGAVDYIFHLAAESHVVNSVVEPIEFIKSNVLGTGELLEYARSLKSLRRFIYMSTDEVFGPAEYDKRFLPDDAHAPHNPYSATKSGGEQLAVGWAYSYKMPIQIIHCMNVFGERQHPEKFIPKAIGLLLAGKPVEVHTDPDGNIGARTYIYAGDVADLLIDVVMNPTGILKENIAGAAEISNLDMARLIAETLGRHLEYKETSFTLGLSCHDNRYDLFPTLYPATTPAQQEQQLRDTILWTVAHPEWLIPS